MAINAQDSFRAFLNILQQVSPDERLDFLALVETEVKELRAIEEQHPVFLQTIIEDLKAKLPNVNAEAPNEHIFFNQQGEFAEYTKTNTANVDAFLYSDDDVDELCDQGDLSRYYCLNCMARNLAPINFISHSASVLQLRYLFNQALQPDQIDGKIVIDVGSRLGAILYAGHYYTKTTNFIGIEFNKYFCDLQNSLVAKHHLADRVSIVCDDVRNCGGLLATADVVILNNVFQFFSLSIVQKSLWQFILGHVKRDAILVTSPSLEQQFMDAKLTIDLSNKLKVITPSTESLPPRWSNHLEDIQVWHLYKVV